MHEVTGSSPVTPTTLKSPVNIGRNDVCGVLLLTPRKVPSGHLVATFAGHLRFGAGNPLGTAKSLGRQKGEIDPLWPRAGRGFGFSPFRPSIPTPKPILTSDIHARLVPFKYVCALSLTIFPLLFFPRSDIDSRGHFAGEPPILPSPF